MKKQLIIVLLSLMSIAAKSQEDSLNLNESKLLKTYNYLTMANREEKSVWKFKIIPLALNDALDPNKKSKLITFDNVPIIIGHERKINTNWSYQIEGKLLYWSQKKTLDEFYVDYRDTNNIRYYSMGTYEETDKAYFKASIAAEVRYYYNMTRKMHRKHTANNFSANYVSFRLSRNVLQTATNFHTTRNQFQEVFDDQNKHYFYDNNASLFYGIQRRFLNHFYIDVQGGLAYRYGKESQRPYWDYWFLDKTNELQSERTQAYRLVGMFNFRVGFAF